VAHTSEHDGARGQADEPQRPSARPCTGLGGKAVDGGRAPSPADTTHEYMGLDLLAKARLHPIESETAETALPTELTA
jgi:hypothetical protein